MLIVINPDGTLTRNTSRAVASNIRAIVGEPGFDFVHVYPRQTLCGFVNDEGFSLGLDRNVVGSCVMAALGGNANILAGPVVITGWDAHARSEVVDLTLDQCAQVERVHGFVRRALAGEVVDYAGIVGWSNIIRRFAAYVRTAPDPQLTYYALEG